MPNEARHMTQERQRTGPGRPRSTCASKWEINKNPGLLPPRHRSVRHFHFPFLLRNVTSPDNLLWSAIHTLHNEPHGLPVNPGFLQGNGTRCQRLRRVRLSRENHQSASCLSIGLQVPLYQSDAYCSGFREIFYWGFFSRNLPKKIRIWFKSVKNYYYQRYSALGPVWAETRAQSGDWQSSGTLHPGQVLRGSLPLLSPLSKISGKFTRRPKYVLLLPTK